jgi:hypothetical protein
MDYLFVTSILLLAVFGLSANVLAQEAIPYDQQMNELETETATFGLGCFWGPDGSFGALEGVVRTRQKLFRLIMIQIRFLIGSWWRFFSTATMHLLKPIQDSMLH